MNNKRLFVDNIDYAVTPGDLEKLFSHYGEVRDVNIIEVRGFGFVEMSSSPQAQKARNALNGFKLEGRNIKVNNVIPLRRGVNKRALAS
ncbi:MAG: RNA-binding protein [Spirochaetota bacterium]|nr:RNA-binding protein [Spirochaetota bacterium]